MHDALIDRYIACWNATDAAARRGLVAATFTEGAGYCDPMLEGEGHAGIDALIAAAQQHFPGLRFSRRGTADAHHHWLRFSWDLGPEGASPIAGGTDMALVAADGRLAAVTGFIDFAPKGA
ncbi:nuclear transport factor 2 family protein [Paracraurococcus ruber]|uniref:Polyketide cyclase n=1 Tax=Paracraurococcus ruber TaxID=77675 RepID=A0ABS1CTY6_9PROT|nr:nuclear transport factor 2 family protein [Paracraurococcus ruber]MBK1657941.1 polyketide cyclase [Paracraurococcus ruber]TDG31625.1 nuclear transport factor 2 family protein [Paracraurococcus ruber]